MTAWMNVHRAACTQNRQGIRWSFGNENMIKPPLGPPSGHQATGGKNSKLMRSDKQLRYSFACLDGGMATDATGTAHLQPFSCQHPIQQIVDQNGPKQGGLDPTLTYYITKKNIFQRTSATAHPPIRARDQVTDASRTRWRTCACQQWFRSWAHNPRSPAAHHLGKLRGAAGPRGDMPRPCKVYAGLCIAQYLHATSPMYLPIAGRSKGRGPKKSRPSVIHVKPTL